LDAADSLKGPRMLRPALALLVFLALPGCAALNTVASGTTPNITQRQVYNLEASYTIIRQGLAVYRRLPWCSATVPAPCQDTKVAIQIKRADKVASDALGQLEAFSKAHDTINLAAAYEAAQRAVSEVKLISDTYVKKGA